MKLEQELRELVRARAATERLATLLRSMTVPSNYIHAMVTYFSISYRKSLCYGIHTHSLRSVIRLLQRDSLIKTLLDETVYL